jgi:hypothetical protein
MHKPHRRIDCADLIQQIDQGITEIDSELGVITYGVIVRAGQGVSDLGHGALDATEKVLNTPYMRHRTAEELSKWDAFSRLPPVNFVLNKLSPETSRRVANTMAKWVGLPTLLAQATSVRKLMLTTTTVGSMFGAMMSTDLGSQMTSACSEFTGLSLSTAETVTGMSLILAAYGVASLLHTAISRKAHDSYDFITARAQSWNDRLERGWRTWLPRATWLGMSKLINPHPPLGRGTLDALASMSQRLPTAHVIPRDEELAIAAVTDYLSRNFGMPSFRAGHVAINLLAHEEPNPNRLLSILKTRDVPQDWISQYQFDPRYCVAPERSTAAISGPAA